MCTLFLSISLISFKYTIIEEEEKNDIEIFFYPGKAAIFRINSQSDCSDKIFCTCSLRNRIFASTVLKYDGKNPYG